MSLYKLKVPNRQDACFGVVNAYTLYDVPIPVGFNPFVNKMFDQDIFTYNDGNVDIIHSSARFMKVIPGVLALENSQTYGRIKDKFLYKCIPDDKRLPIFLVPYKIKLGFNKNIKNKYVVFEFRNWIDKHPLGSLTQTLGDVDSLEYFYEYQLYCKSLYASIQNINKKTMRKLKEKTEDQYIDMIIKNRDLKDYRETRNIFSIDPEKSKDFDDAFDIEELSGGKKRISVYISNVSFWMDAMDLWDSFSNRISTIYLPDRKRPMLPTVLSDALCSLTEGDTRFALELQLIVEDYEVVDYKFYNSVIKLKKNLRYDTKEQENFPDYKELFKTISIMNKRKKYTDSIDSSHDVVAYLMILMNYLSAKELIKLKCGVFRSAKFNQSFVPPEELPKGVKKFLKNWNSQGGKYSKDVGNHDMLELDAYVHITSPIRRLVDLLNMIILQDKLGWKMSVKSKEFYERWTNDSSIEYINTTMRSIRRVQNDCSLLKICMDDPQVQETVYDGYIFDKLLRNDALYQYIVYLPEINMTNRFTSRYDKENLTKQKFKIYVFTDQHSLKRKIRVEVQ
jgi:exoribonuclease R